MMNQDMYGAPPPPQKRPMSGCLIAAIVAGVLAVVGVALLGVMASLSIYGTRKYLAAAKSAEARNSIGAIARSAVTAYEREAMVGDKPVRRLCASSTTVPAAVPRGMKYMPSSSPGADFDTGSETVGWKCLRFSIAEPVYYQYQYHAGSGFLMPASTPGPNGFEAAAQGDLDGDGVLSQFAVTGQVVGDAVTVSPTIVSANEEE